MKEGCGRWGVQCHNRTVVIKEAVIKEPLTKRAFNQRDDIKEAVLSKSRYYQRAVTLAEMRWAGFSTSISCSKSVPSGSAPGNMAARSRPGRARTRDSGACYTCAQQDREVY